MIKLCLQTMILSVTAMVSYVDVHASSEDIMPLSDRIDKLLETFTTQSINSVQEKSVENSMMVSSIRIENCSQYPYHNQTSPVQGYQSLASDIRNGLRIGLQCMVGNGPMGALHPYHKKQANRLLDILESKQTKTFRCVEDKTFAYAISRPPSALFDQLVSGKVLDDIPYPGIAIDTYRLGGFLTTKHQPGIYRDFFKLNDQQIAKHLGGYPQRMERLHRYKNLKALVFHETVHWLGHAHTNMSPDVVDLYETCCFGGSDFISDAGSNKEFQQRACNILKDDELWEADKSQQTHLWRKKGYDQLKLDMRRMYD